VSPIPKMRAAVYFNFSREAVQLAEVDATANDEFEANVIQLFGPNCLINGRVWYFLWPGGVVKHC